MSSSRSSDSPAASAHPPRRWWRPKSLTSRLVLTNVALVALVSVVVATVTTLALRQFLYQRLDDQLGSAADRAELPFSGDRGGPDGSGCDLPGGGERGNDLPFQGPGTLSGSLDTNCTRVLVFTDVGGLEEAGAAAVQELGALPVGGAPRTVDLDGLGPYRVVVTRERDHTIVAGLPTAEVDATLERLVGWEVLVALVGVLLAAAAGRLMVRQQLKPLHEVAATARDVTRLPLSSGEVGVIARVPADLTDPETEVGQLGEALNMMLGHVEQALDARHESELQVRQFVADASHELRTPLSTIQGYAELSRRPGGDDPSALRHAMAKVESESARMATLVDDLLLLARLDSGRPLDEALVDVTRLVVEAVNDARVVDGERHWRLTLPDEPLQVVGDEHRLHQVLSNLLGNASRHTGPGTTVTVSAVRLSDTNQIRLDVSDNGPGLPGSLHGKEFERFTRGDSSRTRASGGAGLGLSIVKAVIVAHGGAVTVTSVPGDTTIAVTLPAADRPPDSRTTA